MAGITPYSLDSLSVARYSIMLKLNGYDDWQDAGYLVNNGRNELNIKLQAAKTPTAKATLTLSSVPAASIYIDGSKVLTDSDEKIRNTVESGKHTIKFTHPEFGTKTFSVNVGGSQSKELTCYFQQQVNIQSLSSSGDPIWGVIYLNGQSTDKTTPGDLNLGPGTYKITVKKTGYRTVENDIQLIISPSLEPQTHSLVFHFK